MINLILLICSYYRVTQVGEISSHLIGQKSHESKSQCINYLIVIIGQYFIKGLRCSQCYQSIIGSDHTTTTMGYGSQAQMLIRDSRIVLVCNIVIALISFDVNVGLIMYCGETRMINEIDRIIPAVGEHIMPEDALAGAYERVGIDKSAQFGVIIAGLQVIETGFGIVQLAAGAKCAVREARFPS